MSAASGTGITSSAGTAASPPAAPPPVRGPPVLDRGTVRHDTVRSSRWVVRGISKVEREVNVGRAELHGTVTVGGAFDADQLTAEGVLEVRGRVSVAGRLRAHGTLDAGGVVAAGEARLVGPVRLLGELSAATLASVRGTLHAPSLRCATLEVKGMAVVPGTVLGTTVDADLHADSALGQVQGRRVRLRGPVPNVVQQLLAPDLAVHVDRIDADSVVLEGVRVGFVRSREVVLGRHAHVGTVEGTVVRSHPSSHVGPESWSRPPAGLTR